MLFRFAILAAAAALGGLATAVSRQPEAFQVERSLFIAASPAKLFEIMADLRRYPEWNPWQKIDANQISTIIGEPATVGTTFSWKGNSKVGQGQMKLARVEMNNELEIDLHFEKPFKADNRAIWTLAEHNGGTLVTWKMTGKNDKIMAKAFAMMVSMDKLVGGQFLEGLEKLKALAERA